jgi:hypothetical protein
LAWAFTNDGLRSNLARPIVRGLKSTLSTRNGALNLFVALNAAAGQVRKKTTKTKTRIDFQYNSP